MRLISSDWLKVEVLVDDPVTADTSYGERLLFVGLPLCDVSAATGPCIQENNYQSIRICLPHAQIRGMTVGHSIALHNAHFRSSEAGNLFVNKNIKCGYSFS